MTNQKRRWMAGIDVLHLAILVEDAKKHGGVAADFRMAAQKAIYVIEHPRGIGAQRHSGKRALQHGGQQRGAQSFSRNVGD